MCDLVRALQTVHGLFRVLIASSMGVTHISEIFGCCLLLGGMRDGLHIVRWVACGGIGAVSDGLGDAGGLSAEVVLRCTPCYCTRMPEKQRGFKPFHARV